MKRKLCIILICVMMMAIIPKSVFASDISLFNNNTAMDSTTFTITASGEARVSYEYDGYEGITTGAEITIKIEKRNFLFYPRAKAFTTTPPTISASLQIASMVCQGKSSATPRPKNSLTCTSTASTPRDCA